ncbi:MAG: calcium/sodium antiporter [Eubacteriales bacterium]
MELIIQVALLIVGFGMLVKGADWFVEGAASIANRFGIPQIVIGLTIVALGTSAPEAAISISAALKGSGDLTIGNVLGSNILNVLVILGCTAVITPLVVQANTFRYEIPFVIFITLLLTFLGRDGSVDFGDGIILWGLLLLFLGYLLYMSKSENMEIEDEDEGKITSMWQLLLLTVLGVGLIVLGSNVTVNSATQLAQLFGLSDRLIGLTVVAFGTSLPELITSVTAGLKGKADIAIGNIIGSNVFNVLFVAGTAALITPITFAWQFFTDGLIATGIVVLLWFFIWKDRLLKRYAGGVLLACYGAYFVYLVTLV